MLPLRLFFLQVGFGWSNGAALDLLNRYGAVLGEPPTNGTASNGTVNGTASNGTVTGNGTVNSTASGTVNGTANGTAVTSP